MKRRILKSDIQNKLVLQKNQTRCLQIFRRLSSYLDGELSPDLCRKIETHMNGCRNCCAFLNTLKRTVVLCQKRPIQPLSRRAQDQLLRRLRREVRKQAVKS